MPEPRSHCRNCGKPWPTDADRDRPADPALDAAICWDEDEEECAGVEGWDRVAELAALVEKQAAELVEAGEIVQDLRRKLAVAGVEGSPPPWERPAHE